MLWPSKNTDEFAASVSAIWILKPFVDIFRRPDNPKNRPQPDNIDRFLDSWTQKICIGAYTPHIHYSAKCLSFGSNTWLVLMELTPQLICACHLGQCDADMESSSGSDTSLATPVWLPQTIAPCNDIELLQLCTSTSLTLRIRTSPVCDPGNVGGKIEWVKDTP